MPVDDTTTIIVRADGGAQAGLGHLYRSAALAQMLNDRYRVVLAYREAPADMVDWLQGVYDGLVRIPPHLRDTDEAAWLADQVVGTTDRALVVLDGYHFGTNYQRAIKRAGFLSLVIDDLHRAPFVTDAVVNHAPGVKARYAGLIPEDRLHTGLDFALLRPEFLDAARRGPSKINRTGSPLRVFICFGGSDPLGLSIRASHSVLATGREVSLVLGSAFRKGPAYEALVQDAGVTAYSNLPAAAMIEVMRGCSVAIVPASSILYETNAVHLPTISGYYVDNQVNIYEGFLREGLIHGVGDMQQVEDYAAALAECSRGETTPLKLRAGGVDGNSPVNLRGLVQTILTTASRLPHIT